MNELLSQMLMEEQDLKTFLISMIVSLLLGGVIAATYRVKSRCTQTMLITLVLLPAIVQTVIMLVNGNIGTGVAVVGAFSLVRFRSAQGNAKDISMIFLAMAAGIATGTGYLGRAVIFTLILCLVYTILCLFGIGTRASEEKELKITIPENLDYSNLFDDLFHEYTRECRLIEVKTASMGSVYRLHYAIRLKNEAQEKEFIDKLRNRNGNFEISCSERAAAEQL